MRKIFALAMVLSLLGLALAGCASSSGDSGAAGDGDAVKLGLGSISSIAKSSDYNVDADGNESLAVGQVDTVIAAASFDSNDRVVDVIIDTAQTKVQFDNEMKVASDKSAEYRTKVELGDEYGMGRVSSIGKEWYEQIAELEQWMVGKTIDEIKAMQVKEGDANHPAVPDEPDLTSLVTISVQNYIAAVEKAYNNAVAVEGAEKLGLGHNISIAKSKDYSVTADGLETLPMAQVDTVMAAAAFDKDGRVAGTLIDTAQVKINYDNEGKVTSDKSVEYKSKVELGDEYGMGRVSSIGKEWYEQIAELEQWMTGKTIAEIKAMKVKEGDENHPAVPDEPDLTSLVTISVQDYIAAVAEAYENAR